MQSWVPKVPLIQNYKDSNYKPLVLFEDDIDLTTWESGFITTFNLESWREEELKFRDNDTQGVNGVIVGWNYNGKMKKDNLASYRVNFDQPGNLEGAGKHLIINMASMPNEGGEGDELVPVDFSMILTDSVGNTGQIRLSQQLTVAPPLQIQFLKLKSVNDDMYTNTWEAALEDVRISLDLFGNQVDLSAVKQIEFRFDRTDNGKFFINEIGVGGI